MSPTRNDNSHLETPDTVKSPDFGSMPRPEQLYDTDTRMIDISTVPQRRQIQVLIDLDYGYIYNQTTIDRNIFTRTSEEAFTLSRQFDDEDERTSSNEEELQSVSENDHSNNNNDRHISDSNNSDESEEEHDSEQE